MRKVESKFKVTSSGRAEIQNVKITFLTFSISALPNLTPLFPHTCMDHLSKKNIQIIYSSGIK